MKQIFSGNIDCGKHLLTSIWQKLSDDDSLQVLTNLRPSLSYLLPPGNVFWGIPFPGGIERYIGLKLFKS